MRSKRLFANTIFALLFQIIVVVSGFIVPRLYLAAYGSEVNGLLRSIAQFISIISFMDMGVGAVVQSAFYKPLADHDINGINEIASSATKFFERLGKILLVYIGALMIIYPLLAKTQFTYGYVASMVLVIGTESFAQYYFGMVDMLLLLADQKGYVYYNIQSLSIIFNVVTVAVIIHLGADIRTVRFLAMLLFLFRPIILRLYINKHYSINRRTSYNEEPIKQKWNGFAQHLANVVLNSTDVVILTLFSTLESVSVYSVYYMVVYGVKQLFAITSNGVQSLWGDMWAKREEELLRKSFELIEWVFHSAVVFTYGCTCSLIVPFVIIYTKDINDADYIVPVFAILISLAHGVHCLRLPYHILIKAAGQYKETQNNYIWSALINIVISVVSVRFIGLSGVAIGTLVAMFYQTVWMADYDHKHILHLEMKGFWKLLIQDVFILLLGIMITKNIPFEQQTIWGWIVYAIVISVIWVLIILIINVILHYSEINTLKQRAYDRFLRGKR